MARPKQETPGITEQPAPAKERFVLKKSAGLIINRQHTFFPAGTEFEPVRDKEIIAFLAQNGAIFE